MTARGRCTSYPAPSAKEHVHFEAPKAERLDHDMKSFLDWFEGDKKSDPMLRAGLAYLWFVDGFEGKLTTSKYATLAKRSQDTAHRDILN